MGCAPSCAPSCGPSDSPVNACDAFAPPPPISVDIGSGVRRTPPNDKAIIFIFGGPGSQKGLVIEELSQRFHFVPICVDEIVFNYLPNKLANTVETPTEVLSKVKSDTGVLSLDWILSMINAKITTSYLQRFVVDLVPEFSVLIKTECFASRNHERSMEKFERTCPIMFAIDLHVIDEGDEHEEHKKQQQQTNGPQLSKELRNFIADDIDKSRQLKRAEYYQKAASPFFSYFNETRRIVRLHLQGSMPNTVSTVRTVLYNFGFTLQRHLQRITLFALRDHSFADIDLDFYRMKKIKMSDIVRKKADLVTQLMKLQRYIEHHGENGENYAVVLDTLSTTQDKLQIPRQRIMFFEKTLAFLDEFIKNRNFSKLPSNRERVEVQVMASTADDLLLFMEPFPAPIAKAISLVFDCDQADLKNDDD